MTCAPWIGVPDVDQLVSEDVGQKVDLDRLVAAATEVLYLLSGSLYCTQEHTVRPYRLGDCACAPTAETVAAILGAGCLCITGTDVILGRNVSAISAVTVEGVVVDPSAYDLVDRRMLVRTDGDGWPCCQRLDVPLGDPGTWSVAFTTGIPVPEAGKLSAIELAVEWAKSMVGDEECQLPRQVQSLTRQNLSMSFNPLEVFEDGKVGLPICDAWLSSLQLASKRRRGASIGWPGMPGLAETV